MFEEWNARLAVLREQGADEQRWSRRLEQLEKDLAEQERRSGMWLAQLTEEQSDVEKLRSLTLTNLFFTLIGKKEEKLEREELEVLAAKVKYDEACRAEDDIRAQIGEIRGKLAEVAGWERDYDELMRAKERKLLDTDEELAALAERVAELEPRLKELKEAVQAGESVRLHLEQAEERIGSARNWGRYDMLGGGMLATHIKHNRIDEAMESVYRAQQGIRRFEAELKDVGMTLPATFDIGGFTRFADYFFDGLIADWIVQGKIKETQAQIREKHGAVAELLRQLTGETRKVEAEVSEAKRRYSSRIQHAE